MNFNNIEVLYNGLIGYIEQYITGERKQKLIDFYNKYQERFMLMPASGREHFHSAYAGGYLVHVNNVVKFTLQIRELWLKNGAVEDHTLEEAVFVAINHDLGKMGFTHGEQYIINESEWHKKNQGLIYKNNPEIPFMMVPDRTLFLLQEARIPITVNEYLGIKLHDGTFEESNKSYFMTNEPSAKLRTNLPFIIQQADMMAARIEYEEWKRPKESKEQSKEQSKAQELFSELFSKKL